MIAPAVKTCLLILVVLNLVFVQITGAVQIGWLVVLYALALASPFLSPLQKFWLYRMVWNAGLVAIFTLLLLDTQQSGIQYMLEDGLTLAAFCQVHALNNLQRQKRPDLVFFNSFLITLVTGFFSQDLGYCLVFVAYAMVLLVGLHLQTCVDLNLRRVISRGSRQGAVAILVTALVFVFWPRDFQRSGLVDPELAQAMAMQQVGFSDRIRLQHQGQTKASNKVAMKIHLRQGKPDSLPMYWRGITFLDLTQQGWMADRRGQLASWFHLDPVWNEEDRGSWQRQSLANSAGQIIQLEVEVLHPSSQRLFTPLQSLRVLCDLPLQPLLDGNLRLSHAIPARSKALRYQVSMHADPLPATTLQAGYRQRVLSSFLQLPEGMIPPSARQIHDQLRQKLPAQASNWDLCMAYRTFLSQNFNYLLPGEQGAAGSFHAFLQGEGGGHCEYFASALTILLRMDGIPCRMVGGFLAHEWDEEEKTCTVRERHAHAWVEVFNPKQGWRTVDPTPARQALAKEQSSMLGSLQDKLSALWLQVTSFDAQSRSQAMAWLRDRLAALIYFSQLHPFQLLLGLSLLLWLLRWRRRPAPVQASIRNYQRCLRRVGLQMRQGETPRQLLLRAQDMDLPPTRLKALGLATRQHEHSRYASV